MGLVVPACICVCMCAWEEGRERGTVCAWMECYRPPVISAPGAAPWGKRGWKMFHTLLRGMVLYFLKVAGVLMPDVRGGEQGKAWLVGTVSNS